MSNQAVKLGQFESLTEREKIQRVSAVIRYGERKLKRSLPVLQHQDALGAILFSVSILGIVLNSVLYWKEIIPAWACIVGNAFFASVLHELEHDLLHHLYFRSKPFFQNILMAGVWLFRGNIISPWYRREIHLLHHRVSGQLTDIEERLIGNGVKNKFKRFLMTLDPMFALLNVANIKKDVAGFGFRKILMATLPIYGLFYLIFFCFVGQHGLAFFMGQEARDLLIPATLTVLVNFLAVVYIFPNFLRQASLVLISSNCHYFGDVPKGVDGMMKQAQVLDKWYLWPFQLFCFNFGSTHVIHHFVVNQTFYLRQLIAPFAHSAMRKYGVRFNDLGTFARGNRLEQG